MGMTALLGTALSTAAGVGSSLITDTINQGRVDAANTKQFAQQKQLMQFQDELQGKRWNQQMSYINAFNDPASQIKRLENAGINPNVAFQNGVQGNYTSVSPEASVGLGSTQPQFSPIGELFPKDFFAQLVESATKQQDSNTKRMEAQTNRDLADSSITLQAQQVENLMKQGQRTDAEIAQIKEQTAAIGEQLKINWRNLQQGLYDLKIKALRLGVEYSQNKWQEEVARYNSFTDRANSTTQRLNFQLGKERLRFETEKFDKEFTQKKNEFSSLMRQGNIDRIVKLFDISSINIAGTKVASPHMVADAIGLCESYIDNLSKMTDETKVRLAPLVDDTMKNLEQIQLKAKNYNYKKPWKSPYLQSSFDASDGF